MAWSRWRARRKRRDGAPVSMTLTSTLLRRRTSRRNPRIPTIPAGGFCGEVADVSAVDTWLLVGSTPRGVGATPAPARVGLLHEGGDLLTEGCAYCTNPRPRWSIPNPPPVAPEPRAVGALAQPTGPGRKTTTNRYLLCWHGDGLRSLTRTMRRLRDDQTVDEAIRLASTDFRQPPQPRLTGGRPTPCPRWPR